MRRQIQPSPPCSQHSQKTEFSHLDTCAAPGQALGPSSSQPGTGVGGATAELHPINPPLEPPDPSPSCPWQPEPGSPWGFCVKSTFHIICSKPQALAVGVVTPSRGEMSSSKHSRGDCCICSSLLSPRNPSLGCFNPRFLKHGVRKQLKPTLGVHSRVKLPNLFIAIVFLQCLSHIQWVIISWES